MSQGTNKLAYVHSFKDRHGKVRRYFRKDGKRTPLPGKPGSAECDHERTKARSTALAFINRRIKPSVFLKSLAL
jgi:hypothetical protein